MVVVCAAPLPVLLATAGAAGAVGDDATFRAAWATDATVTLTQSFSLDCSKPTPPRSTAAPVTLEGNGFTLTQCTDPDRGFVDQSGSGAVTLHDLHLSGSSEGVHAVGDLDLVDTTMVGYSHGPGTGAAISSPANVTLAGSSISGATASDVVFAVDGTSSVTLTDSTISATSGTGAFGIAGKGDMTLVNSHVIGTQATTSPATGISTQVGDVSLTGSTVTATHSTDAEATGIATSGTATISGSVISDTHSAASALGVGGAGGTTVVDSTVSDTVGGGVTFGIGNDGPTVVQRSTVSGTSGGVLTSGITGDTTSTVDTTVTATSDSEVASGVRGLNALSVVGSTVSRTSAPRAAGVLGLNTALVVNSTITDNEGSGTSSQGDTTLVYSDVVGNGPVGGPAFGATQVNAEGSITVFGSVIADPRGGIQNCISTHGTMTSAGYNFADDNSCGFTATGDREGVGLDPQLGPLADNGGPTPTFLPAATSPLVDAIPIAACSTNVSPLPLGTDQRGAPRPSGNGCDIGSVEVQPSPAPSPAIVTPRFTG